MYCPQEPNQCMYLTDFRPDKMKLRGYNFFQIH